MKRRHRVLAWILAGALVLAGVPARAEGSAQSAAGPAQESFSEGETILVTSTIYVSWEDGYSLEEGVTLQAAEGLDGPILEVAEDAELTLCGVTLVGNGSMLIANHGILRLDDSVSLLVKDGGGVGCVYTAAGAATYLNGELVAGEDQQETEEESEAEEASGETDSDAEGAAEPETGESETKETETAVKEPETEEPETVRQTEGKTPETPLQTETDQTETDQTETDHKQTDHKQPESTEAAETEKTKDLTTEAGETETEKQETSETKKAVIPETEDRETEEQESVETETEASVRKEAVETVKNAIMALSIHSREDVRSLLPVSQAYDGLTEQEKAAIPQEVRQLLESAKEMAAAYNHTQLGVSVYGNLPWYVQFQVKRTEADSEGGRF